MNQTTSSTANFDFKNLSRHRVADQCVCCGSRALQAAPAILMPFVAHRTFGWEPALIDASWGLATVQKGMTYTVCRSLQCSDCGLLFSDIRFSDHELGQLYQDYRGAAYTTLRETYEPGYTLRNDSLGQEIDYGGIIEDFLQPHLQFPLSLLDWGGDTGKNTPFKDRCSRFDVFDISNKDVIAGARAVTLEQALATQYDLVVCSNVLEHIPYPSDMLEDMKQAMGPGSVLYIEVPYEEVVRLHGGAALAAKKHWHEHINFFSPQALQQVITNCGLKIVAMNAEASITAGLKSSYLMQVACKLA
jgi:hypothetical protein